VYAQLLATSAGNWISCGSPAVTTGLVTCTPTGGQIKALTEVTGLSVVAYG
jgi:hypothetical protein